MKICVNVSSKKARIYNGKKYDMHCFVYRDNDMQMEDKGEVEEVRIV